MDILNETRIGEGEQQTHALPEDIGYRNAFDADADRIAFSGAFRRLQDKTQVHGPAGNDHVRSRLTHSMEVSRVGRQIGEIFGNIVLHRAPELARGHHPADFASATAAACLMHDIGNPPFGHTGERAISEYFLNSDIGREVIKRLGADHPLGAEALKFEGNAQGLRVVAALEGWRPTGGLRLTAAVMAGFCKYPFAASTERSVQKKGKYGFFHSEAKAMEQAASLTGMTPHAQGGWHRHPIAYLVEAADDTCYRIVDIEDGYVMSCLSFDEAEGLLMAVSGTPDDSYRKIESKTKRLERLRSLAISKLIREVADTLRQDFDAVINGTHVGDLVVAGDSAKALKEIEVISKARIFNGVERTQTDILAYKTINGLLDAYLSAFMARHDSKGNGYAKAVLKSLPHVEHVENETAHYLRFTLDYLSGMTDDFAIKQARLFPRSYIRAA